MKFFTLLFWLVLTIAMNFPTYASSDKSEPTVEHDLLHSENTRMKTFSNQKYIVLNNDPYESKCYVKSSDMDHSDGSCNYPENFSLIKSDEEFADGETRFVYIKVDGPVCCGEILINPKGGPKCYSDLRIAGPAVLSADGVDRTSLNEIGTYDPNCVSGLEKCEEGDNIIYRDGHILKFHGWQTLEGGSSIWYYEVKSAAGKGTHAISHLTFALVDIKASCGAMNTLGSFVWNDDNNNGLQDEGSEAGIAGIKVKLYKDGIPTGQFQITDKRGKYLFTGLPDGEYQVKFEIPDTYHFTGKSMGDGRNDSKADPHSGMSDVVVLSGGMDYMYSDAGLVFTILPIILSDFRAEQDDDGVLLTWETAAEIHSDYFEVQKSIDGFTFHTISMVEASHYSSSTLNYSSKDREPAVGSNFYRLKQVDLDGAYSYSDVRKVDVGRGQTDLTVYPNPSSGQITIRLSRPGTVHGRIYNASGVEIRRIILGSGKSVLNLQDLNSGMYYILLQDGNVQQTVKLIRY